MPDDAPVFLIGEGELRVADVDFLVATGEEVPGTLLPSGDAILGLAFLLVMGLALGDGTLFMVLPEVVFSVLVFGNGETMLVADFGAEKLTPVSESPSTLSIISITLNSNEVCECPVLSGGVINFSDEASWLRLMEEVVAGTLNRGSAIAASAVSLLTELESLAVTYSLLPLSPSGSFFFLLPSLVTDLFKLSQIAGTSTHLSL